MRSSLAALAALTLVASCAAPPPADDLAQGTVEVREADLAAPVPARVVRVLVDEGDAVEAGDTLVLLTQSDLDATLAGHRARVATAEAVVRDLRAGARPEEITRAEAELAAAAAEADRSARELERVRTLTGADLASRQRLDDAESQARVAAQRRDAARESVLLLRAGARPEAVRAAEAEVRSAQAALRAAESRAADLVLTSSWSGTVLLRLAQPGEVLAAGMPAMTIGETGVPWVRAWVPHATVERLRVGSRAMIRLGGSEIAAQVTAINPRAEFTPRVALTEEERADLMFGVRVEPVSSAPALKAGLWVQVRFLLDTARAP